MNDKWWKKVKSLDPNIEPDSDSAYCAAMLLCAAENGADVEGVVRLTGVPAERAIEIEARLRDNGVWVGEKTHHGGWTDEGEAGAIAFWMDVCVGVGFMVRAKPRRKIKSQKYGAAAVKPTPPPNQENPNKER